MTLTESVHFGFGHAFVWMSLLIAFRFSDGLSLVAENDLASLFFHSEQHMTIGLVLDDCDLDAAVVNPDPTVDSLSAVDSGSH